MTYSTGSGDPIAYRSLDEALEYIRETMGWETVVVDISSGLAELSCYERLEHRDEPGASARAPKVRRRSAAAR